MILRNDLILYLNKLLAINIFNDYCPNGLQVEGKPKLNKIITGVTACQQLIDAAIDQQADAIIVHHGYFWKNENPCITGLKYKRIKALIQNKINLFAYHLPLDSHNIYGNNVQLANILGIQIDTERQSNNPTDLLFTGSLKTATPAEIFKNHIQQQLDRKPLLISGGDHMIKTIGWCTGAAQQYIEEAKTHGLDAFISGEISENTVHFAREAGIHYFAAGHHHTEKYGAPALGEHLADKFSLEHVFIDIPNPV